MATHNLENKVKVTPTLYNLENSYISISQYIALPSHTAESMPAEKANYVMASYDFGNKIPRFDNIPVHNVDSMLQKRKLHNDHSRP